MNQTTQTVEQVASRVVLLERTPHSAECRSAPFQRRFTDIARNPFFGWNPGPQMILNFQLSDVVLDGEFRGLLNTDGFISGTGYLLPDDFLMGLRVHADNLIPVQQAGTIVIGCNLAYKNYFHWCSQALPAIDNAVQRIGQDRRVTLALPQLTAWQEESLQLLGHSGLRRLTITDQGKQYALDLAEFSQILNGGSAFALSDALYGTFTRLRQAVDKLPGPARNLYVARTDAQGRVMRNETAVIQEMRSRGYEIVIPGSLSFTQQVRLFRSASLVVGPHGAGLTNIIFCEPGTTIYELVPDCYANSCFCNLAMVCRLQYWADAFASDDDDARPPNLRDWESDRAVVAARLTEIDAILAGMVAEEARQTISAMDFLRGKPGMWHGRAEPEPPPLPQLARPVLLRGMWQTLFGRSRGR